jgi:hypothetical protein
VNPSPDKPRVPDDDWRRLGQEKHLKNKALDFGKYTPPRPDWDHDHCEYCNAKFSLFPGDLTEGYSADDKYYWVCAECFADFKDEFEWTVKREITSASRREPGHA